VAALSGHGTAAYSLGGRKHLPPSNSLSSQKHRLFHPAGDESCGFQGRCMQDSALSSSTAIIAAFPAPLNIHNLN